MLLARIKNVLQFGQPALRKELVGGAAGTAIKVGRERFAGLKVQVPGCVDQEARQAQGAGLVQQNTDEVGQLLAAVAQPARETGGVCGERS